MSFEVAEPANFPETPIVVAVPAKVPETRLIVVAVPEMVKIPLPSMQGQPANRCPPPYGSSRAQHLCLLEHKRLQQRHRTLKPPPVQFRASDVDAPKDGHIA